MIIKCILSLAAIVLACHSPAEVVRSMLGARGAIMSANAWKNPYITDGLIAMWDGEWNAGGGVHDAAATVWKDIVGGKTIQIPKSSHVSDKSVSFSQDASSSGISYDSDTPAYSVFHTFKMVNQDHVEQHIFRILHHYGTKMGVGAISWNPTISVPLMAFRSVNFQKIEMPDYTAPCQIGIIYSTKSDSSYQGNIFAIYANGSKVYELTGPNWKFQYEFELTGAYYICAATNRVQDVYNSRLYSRALTASEIAQNYAIDKARFNLP